MTKPGQDKTRRKKSEEEIEIMTMGEDEKEITERNMGNRRGVRKLRGS